MMNKTFTKTVLSQVVIAASIYTAPVYSQDKAIEEIVVVGSRIARSADFEGPTPVQIISRDEINKTGYNNLQQIFEKLPAMGAGTFSTRGNNQDSTANGAAAVSLRGLGSDATLVLVNGRRVAISSFAEGITTNFVDINSIPVSAIERVEVLKDGASAVYGSDAVAGVVNVVLRQNFEGVELSTSFGNTLDSDNDEQSISAVWGINGDNNSNVTMILDYFKNSSLMNVDRGDLGSANQTSNGGADLRSSRGFPGTFVVDGVATIDPNCPASSIDITSNVCRYDYGPWNVLTPEAERTGLTILGHRDISEAVEMFGEIGVQHNTSIALGAPTPLDEDAGLNVPVTHPNNPFVGATAIDIKFYRTVDAGARAWDIETDNLRMLLGFRGDINNWNWEFSAQRGRSESTQTGSRSQGWVRTDFLQQEIDAGRYNPFGGTTNPQSVINAITTSLVRQGKSELTSYEASITGNLFELSAGPAAIAAGVEHREESVKDLPDDQFQRGLIFGTESVSARADRDITSVYFELALPLFEGFDFTLAARHDDYSDFGTTTNPMLNFRWALSDHLSLRASWGTGFRAPSLAQIGLGPSQESIFFEDTFGCAINATHCGKLDYNVTFSGNPNLEAEESESYNIGLIYEASDSLRFSLDYYEIEQEDKIDKVNVLILYNQFCNSQTSTICVRSAPLPGDTLGSLSSINTSFINIGEENLSGLDLSVQYEMELGGGDLNLNFDYSFLSEYERATIGSGFQLVTRDVAGEYEYPEHRWIASADWQLSNWSVGGSLNFIGEFDDTPSDITDNETVDSFMTLNLQVSYNGFDKAVMTIGLDNALDEDPPFAIGDFDSDLYGYVSGLHSPRGQFLYGKLTYEF